MPIQLNVEPGGKFLVINVSGKVTGADYGHFVPEFERVVSQHGKVRVLFEMTDFHGWDVSAFRNDINFEIEHFFDIERLATVGDKKWEEVMSVFWKPFATATVRYFDHADTAGARKWLAGE